MGYKEVFRLLKENKIWYGPSITSGDREFMVPPNTITRSASLRIDENGNKFVRVPGVHWFTNLDHGRRHEPLKLMSMKDNLRYSKHKELVKRGYYERYFHYGFIDVPYSDAIPSDYDGEMGVPITFLDKYCPEQFEILGISTFFATAKPEGLPKSKMGGPQFYVLRDGQYERLYNRLIIRKKQ